MSIRNLIPWRRSSSRAAVVYRDPEANLLPALHREVNRLFEDAFRGFVEPVPAFAGLPSWRVDWPDVEISETGKEIRVTAELPGLEEKDIEVVLEDGMLTLRGEKHAETADKDRRFSERFYGGFERRIPLESEIEEEKVAAAFKNGLLTVTLPKTARAQEKAKRIAINGSS